MKDILIFYEGESELIYINKLKQIFNISRKKISMRLKKETISSKSINMAFHELKGNDYDCVFIICDREESFDRIKVLSDCEQELNKKNSSNTTKNKNTCF